jgi:hypothetical protein
MRRWRVGAIIVHQVNADLELWQARIIQGRERQRLVPAGNEYVSRAIVWAGSKHRTVTGGNPDDQIAQTLTHGTAHKPATLRPPGINESLRRTLGR